jgi:hypothetical protein
MWDVADEVGQFSVSTSVFLANSHSTKMIHTHLSSRSDTIDQLEADVPSHRIPGNLLFLHNVDLEHDHEGYI